MHAESDPHSPDGEPFEAAEVIDLEVRESKGRMLAEPARGPGATLARSAGEMAMAAWLSSIRGGIGIGRSVFRMAADTSVGRLIGEAASGAVSAVTQELDSDWHKAGKLAEDRIGQVISVVVPVVVQSLDPVELMEYVDINAILEEVDIDAILDTVDINHLLDRVDVNGLLDRVDVDQLMARADVDALMARVDVNALMARVDIDALIARVDVAAIAKRAEIGDLVAESTSDVAGSALDLGRRQAVGVDTLLARTMNRVLGRDSDSMPQGPPLLVDAAEDAES